MDTDFEKTWQDVLQSIKVSVSQPIFSTWFSQTHLLSVADNPEDSASKIVEISCHSAFAKATIESRYFSLVQENLSRALGKNCHISLIVKQTVTKPETEVKTEIPLFATESRASTDLGQKIVTTRLRPGFSFDNFAVSPSNQMAWAAAEAVADKPGTAYNPFFLWGGVGVGKSHLMFAIGSAILKADPEKKIFFCTGEEFTNGIVEGIRNKTTENFRNKYRKLDVLLIDDIQFIAGKDTVQEEFFHTFNAVTASGGQIILTSDKPPSEIAKLEERLKSRFEAGLIVDIAPPDFELRCAITQIKTKDKGLELEMPLIQLIAGNIDSARQIEGFLIRLTSEARLKKLEITEELIKTLLAHRNPNFNEAGFPKKSLNSEQVINAVCKYFSMSKKAMWGQGRARSVARPRQMLMYLLRTEVGLPLQEVGRIIGGRDHTTVMHAVENITKLASSNVKIREDLMGIKNFL